MLCFLFSQLITPLTEVSTSSRWITCGKEKVVVVSLNLVPGGCHFALVDDQAHLIYILNLSFSPMPLWAQVHLPNVFFNLKYQSCWMHGPQESEPNGPVNGGVGLWASGFTDHLHLTIFIIGTLLNDSQWNSMWYYSCSQQHPDDQPQSLGAEVHLSRGYMVIKWWFFKHFTQQETTGYMLSYFTKKIPLWSECTQGLHCDYIWKKHHFDHNVSSNQILIKFKKKTAQKPVGSLWKKILVSFTILFTMYPPWIWATHWEFFHKIPCNVITMSPADSPQRNHKEITLWLNFTTNSQRTLWVYGWIHCDHIAGNFVKELSMSGSDSEWIHCK